MEFIQEPKELGFTLEPDSRPKWSKSIPLFQFLEQKGQKPYSLGRHIPIWLRSGSIPPPPRRLHIKNAPEKMKIDVFTKKKNTKVDREITSCKTLFQKIHMYYKLAYPTTRTTNSSRKQS